MIIGNLDEDFYESAEDGFRFTPQLQAPAAKHSSHINAHGQIANIIL